MPKLIALTGYKTSGKSTAANGLIDRGFVRARFADPIKQAVYSLGLTYDEVEGHLKDQPCELLNGLTPRDAQKSLGTEWGRNMVHPDIWVNVWRRTARRILGAGHDVVVDDLRFPNEAAALLELGATIIRVVRPGLEPDLSHESEAHIGSLPVTQEILNDGTVDDLRAAVLDIARYAPEVRL